MIRYQEMVPDYYIEKSRDFQVLCRMYDFAMNGLKYNIDSMQSLTDTRNIKDTVLPLLGDKFGIYDKEAYANRQMLEALPIAIKYKGSLKSVNVLLNAFLDSMDIFKNAIAMYARTEEEAEEISSILNRTIRPFSLVIILSTFPNLTNLHVLDTYLKMVIPTGMIVDYGFGLKKIYLDKFKYKEYVFLYYTKTRTYDDEPMTVPMVSLIKNKSESYGHSPVFTYTGTDNLKKYRQLVGENTSRSQTEELTIELRHTAAPLPPASTVEIYQIDLDLDTNTETVTLINYQESGTYTIEIPPHSISYVQYYYNKMTEFIDKINEADFDVNSVAIGAVMSKDEFEEG